MSATPWFAIIPLAEHCDHERLSIPRERGAGISKGVVREVLNHRLISIHPHVVQVRCAAECLVRTRTLSTTVHDDWALPQFKQVFTTPRYLAIVMEYVAGGDLCGYFIENGLVGVGLPEDLARWFFQQIVLALEFMHKKGVANRYVHSHMGTHAAHHVGYAGTSSSKTPSWTKPSQSNR